MTEICLLVIAIELGLIALPVAVKSVMWLIGIILDLLA